MAVKKETKHLSTYDILGEIQTSLKAPKNMYNSFGKYKYRNLEGILEGLKPLLKKHNCALVISDEVVSINEMNYVKATVVLHFDGGSISSQAFARESVVKKGMDDSQITGATSSYARKYACNGLFAIDDTVDADGMDNSKEGSDDLTEFQIKKVKKLLKDGNIKNGFDDKVLKSIDDGSFNKKNYTDYMKVIKQRIEEHKANGKKATAK
tara:strand:+ start:36 stop:662 length:627 start_codon:yes stop_codon:yes gene_type:complete